MSALVEIVFIMTGIHAPTRMDGFWMIEIDVRSSSGSKRGGRVMSDLTKKHTDKHTETHACDLISRQAAIDALADYIHNVDKVMGTGHLNADDCKDAATSVFEDLPSVQPEIVKCCKCGFWDRDTLRHQFNDFRDWNEAECKILAERDPYHEINRYTEADDFCSRAERREK